MKEALSRLRRFATRIAATGVLAAACSTASAVPIPPGTTSADDLLFNFDFPPLLTGAPYADMSISAVVSLGHGDQLDEDVFTDLNGGGTLKVAFGPLTGNCTVCPQVVTITIFGFTTNDILDGIFSVGFRAPTGTPELISIEATATNAAGQSLTIAGIAAVPEPASVALLAIALAAFATSRRRRV